MRNLFAYTEPPTLDHFYPAYISVNERSAGKVTITVRSRDSQTGQEIEMPPSQITDLIYALQMQVNASDAK